MYDVEYPRGKPERFAEECAIIGLISDTAPRCSDMRHFHTGGVNITGHTEFRWKYHRDRILHVRWEGTFLSIRQTLFVDGKEYGVSFPVTWHDGKRTIPFDGNGQVRLPEEASHEFWCEALGITRCRP